MHPIKKSAAFHDMSGHVLSAQPPMAHSRFYPSLAGFLHQVVIVRNLGCGILLVVLTLGVEEFLQHLSEGLDLVLRHACLEVVGATELLVELLRTVQSEVNFVLTTTFQSFSQSQLCRRNKIQQRFKKQRWGIRLNFCQDTFWACFSSSAWSSELKVSFQA